MRQILEGLGSIASGLGRLLAKVLIFRFNLPVVIMLVPLVIGVMVAVAIIKNSPELIGLRKGPEDIKRDEESLVERVRSKVDLPTDETPTLATVTDVEKLAGQAFFTKAQNGDRVLIYSKARKVILYRPSEDRIIEIGSVNINENQQGVTSDEPLKFVILNGTETSGLTEIMEADLKAVLSNADILSRENAKENYEETILIDLVGNTSVANNLAQSLSLKLGELPSGEDSPEGVDFVIILGEDKIVEVNTQTPSPTPDDN
jgi:hypothetical protein